MYLFDSLALEIEVEVFLELILHVLSLFPVPFVVEPVLEQVHTFSVGFPSLPLTVVSSVASLKLTYAFLEVVVPLPIIPRAVWVDHLALALPHSVLGWSFVEPEAVRSIEEAVVQLFETVLQQLTGWIGPLFVKEDGVRANLLESLLEFSRCVEETLTEICLVLNFAFFFAMGGEDHNIEFSVVLLQSLAPLACVVAVQEKVQFGSLLSFRSIPQIDELFISQAIILVDYPVTARLSSPTVK